MLQPQERTRPALRSLIARPIGLVAPGAFDMLSARIIEELGFEAVYFTGYGNVTSHLGLPDAGLMTMTEMVERVHNMANAVALPVIADADTGYGNVISVIRTVREYEGAGAAAIQIEDQVAPKKCGHTRVRELIPAAEMARKIEAAVNTRRNDDFLIIARTDARAAYGVEEAILRAQCYKRSGADLVFIEAPRSLEELRKIGEAVEPPLMANMVEGGRTPLVPLSDLAALGYKLVIYPVTTLKAAAFAIRETLKVLKRDGIATAIEPSLYTTEEMHVLAGFEEVFALEERYAA